MIRIDNINKYYNKGKANQIHVIDNTTLTLPDKGIFCFLGPSGCGKTTLLNAIGGLDKVDSGTITIDDQLITRSSSDEIDNIRNAHIGYIFQNYNLLDDRTVFENAAIALRMTGITDETVVSDRVRYCLEKTGMDQYRNKLAGALSGGQRQRVAIARAIVKNPSIIIADEPTGNLDSANTLEIMNIIKSISKERLVILVTHEQNIAEFYSDYIAEIRDGKVVSINCIDPSRSLDYKLENKIYLKDMDFHTALCGNGVSIDVYSDQEQQPGIKLVIRDKNLYVDTGGNLNVLDGRSSVELIDDHYNAIDETIFEESDFDYTAYLPAGHNAKYTSVYKLPRILSDGWACVKSFSSIRKLLLAGFVFAAMFAFLAISSVLGTLEVEPVDYRTTNTNYITVYNPEKTEDLIDLVGSLDNVDYVLPGETRIRVTLPMDDYIQSESAQEDIAVSLVLTSVLDPELLVAGAMPAGKNEVVLDRMVIERFLRDRRGKAIGLDSMEKFIGRSIEVPNLDEYRITGISDTGSPSLFADDGQAMYILSNARDANEKITISFADDDAEESDIVRNGKMMDLDLTKSRIEITKGRRPEAAYEVIVNEIHANDVKIGKTIKTEVNGQKLKVVGYYKSNTAYDDAYYVHADTIKKYYTGKQKYFTVYTQNTALLKAMFDEAGISSNVNDARDKAAYMDAHKEQLISSIIVAAVIVLISLIEMFLMLRSSFLSRIKEVGTLRAIGLKKGDIYKMFTGEILVMTGITAIPGIALMYFILTQFAGISYSLQGRYLITPSAAAAAFGLLLVFNLLAGLIPVFTTMRKTPAQILARSDI